MVKKKQIMHVAVKTTHIHHLFGTHYQMLSKIAPGHMRTCSISFHCTRTESKSAEIMLHKPSNAKSMGKKPA